MVKLKEDVNNNNLLPIGGILVHCDGTSNGTLSCYGDSGKLISKADGAEITISSGSLLAASSLQEGDYIFRSKYKSFLWSGDVRSTSQGFSFNIEDLKYYSGFDNLPNIVMPKSEGIIGNLDMLPASNSVNSIVIWSTGISFNLSTLLAHYPNVGKNNGDLNILNMNAARGNIADLAALKYMPRNLYISQTIGGNFYDAIVGWRTNINVTGEKSGIIGGANVHLWSVYPGKEREFGIAWTENTSSITVNGVTTTFDNSGNIVS